MLCIICSTACTVESVAERRLWEIQQDEALLDVESTPSGNAKRRVHSVTTEMVLCVFFLDFFWTRVWIWHCHRQQHHCCRIVGKPASQCICIHSIWDDQNCGFYKIWNEMRFAKGWVTEVNCENHSHSHTVIHVCFLHTRCATLPPVHDVPEIPGLDDFTVYLIMAGSFAAVDQIVCCIVCLLIGHFHKLLFGFFTYFHVSWKPFYCTTFGCLHKSDALEARGSTRGTSWFWAPSWAAPCWPALCAFPEPVHLLKIHVYRCI